ncbi:hypothetical protein GGR50DRAFT_610008 [Xylaria sp. CBS 124048]|nr:hypothetical protein GGR50DRAFT_610008 [Xylaria sp. CBS 124048]
MSSQTSGIRIAIIGGGIAAAILLRGLLRYPHIAVEIYTSRPVFAEDSHSTLSFTPAAEEIMLKIDPALADCLDAAEAVLASTSAFLAAGPHAGQRVDRGSSPTTAQRIVEAQRFLAEVLRGMPPRMVHPNTRISSIAELVSPNSGVLLTFPDGTQKKYDVVIGADGIHGATREFVLGPSDPALRPRHTGVWRLPIQVPYRKAVEAMGSSAFLDPAQGPCQTAWIGRGTYLQCDFMGVDRDVYITAYGYHDEFDADGPWARLLTPEEFGAVFEDTTVSVCRGMINLIQAQYTVQVTGLSYMQHRPARTYVSHTAALIDESAHSVLTLRGINILIALEEVYVLLTLFSRSSFASKTFIPAALQAFDAVCRPRAEEAEVNTNRYGLMAIGRDEEVGLDVGRMEAGLGYYWGLLREDRIEERRGNAVGIMEGLSCHFSNSA